MVETELGQTRRPARKDQNGNVAQQFLPLWRVGVEAETWATMAAPNDFDVTLHHGDGGGMDALRDAAPLAYELREGKAMKPLKTPQLELEGPQLDEEDFAAYLPKTAAAFEEAR